MSSAAIVPLLLVLFPLAMAGGCLVLRRMPRTVVAAGLVGIAVEGWLALSASAPPGRVLESGAGYDGFGRIVLLAACAGAFLATLAAAAGKHGEFFVATELLIIGCIAGISVTGEPLLGAGLLLLSGLLGGVQLADRPAGGVELIDPRRLGSALRHTVLAALSGLVMLFAITLLASSSAPLATSSVVPRLGYGMLLWSYAVRCGFFPFNGSLSDSVERAPPSTAALQCGVLAVSALPVLLSVFAAQPQLLLDNQTGRRLLIGLGALAALVGGGLGAIGDARRSLGYLASANLGLLTIGIGLGSPNGVEAALLGAIGHSVGIGLAALGLALLPCSSGRGAQFEDTRARWTGAVALLSGVLLLTGIPPFAGFAPRLLLLAAAWQNGYIVAAIVVASITLMALAAGRLLSDALRPPPDDAREFGEPAALGSSNTPRVSRVLLALTVLLSLAAAGGVWLLPLTEHVAEAVRGLLP